MVYKWRSGENAAGQISAAESDASGCMAASSPRAIAIPARPLSRTFSCLCLNLSLQGDASVQRRQQHLCSGYTTPLFETIDADFATSEEQRIVQCGSWRIASRAHRCVRMMDPYRIAARQDSPGRLAT